MKLTIPGVLAAVLGFGAVAGQAAAQAIVSTGQSFVTARFLPGAAQADGARMAGLRLTLAPGWKTYWRSPGEAGIPPHFDWSGSRNIQSVEVLWPRPGVFQSFGMRTVGYADRVLLPLRITPEDATLPIDVALTADVGVCRELCVLERFDVAETIAPGARSIGWAQIERAVKEVPMPAADAGLVHVACRISGAGEDRKLAAAISCDPMPYGAEVLVEGNEVMWIRDAETHAEDGVLHVSADVRLGGETAWIDRSAIRMTVLADGFAADIHGCKAGAG